MIWVSWEISIFFFKFQFVAQFLLIYFLRALFSLLSNLIFTIVNFFAIIHVTRMTTHDNNFSFFFAIKIFFRKLRKARWILSRGSSMNIRGEKFCCVHSCWTVSFTSTLTWASAPDSSNIHPQFNKYNRMPNWNPTERKMRNGSNRTHHLHSTVTRIIKIVGNEKKKKIFSYCELRVSRVDIYEKTEIYTQQNESSTRSIQTEKEIRKKESEKERRRRRRGDSTRSKSKYTRTRHRQQQQQHKKVFLFNIL